MGFENHLKVLFFFLQHCHGPSLQSSPSRSADPWGSADPSLGNSGLVNTVFFLNCIKALQSIYASNFFFKLNM